ncbi:MAG: branched-chain amino acid ABC transporter permease [Rhodospirillales bacterium]|nr:branched-chain amino acid ABC transporter permease [Rhodospirillales bacterium]
MVETRRQAVVLLATLVLLLVLPALATAVGMPYLLTLGSQVVIYAIAAASLDLLIGYAGLPSFGHAGFFGLGAYVVGILAFHAADQSRFLGLVGGATQAWIVWPAAIGVCALAALATGALSLRTAGVSFIMITLAFAQMLYFLFVALKIYGGTDGLGFDSRNTLPGIDPSSDTEFYYICVMALVLVLGVFRFLVRSRFGMVLEGLRQNERRMAAIGLASYRVRLVAFTIAGAGAGLAGALDANLLRYVSPDALHWTMSGDLLVMVVLGGVGSLYGAFYGAVAFVGLQSLLSQWTEHWMIVLGPILVGVVLLARRGLWGVLAGASDGGADGGGGAR